MYNMYLYGNFFAGIPAIFTIVWALCMNFLHSEQTCWRDFVDTPYFYLITIPVIVVALVSIL